MALSYREVPGKILDDPDTLIGWAQKAFDAALVKTREKKPRSKKRARG